MAITRLGGANAITGTLPAANINDTSIGNITALPAAIATGKVLQVVQDTDSTETSTTSQTFVTSSLAVSITPSSTSNKILVISSSTFYCPGVFSNADNLGIALYRDSTKIFDSSADARFGIYADSSNPESIATYSISYQDSPSSISAISYSLRFRSRDSGTVTYNGRSGTSSIIAMEIAS